MDPYIGKVFECDKMPSVFIKHTNSDIDNVCSTTPTVFTYYAPPEAGVRVGDKPYTQYFMANVHFENHHDEVGVVITQTLRIWHTGQLRKNDLDMIEFDLSSNNGFAGFGVLIPPFEPHFTLKGVFNTYCLDDVIIVLFIYRYIRDENNY